MSFQVQRRWFSVDDYYRMIEAGILLEDDRVELIEGEVIKMSPIGKTHAACVKRINSLFGRLVGAAAIISVQDPIRVDDFSEPQPDIAILKPRDDFYKSEHPAPADVFLIVEVADTSIQFDHMVNLPLYARAGIPEVWLADLVSDRIEIHSRPVNGRYQDVRELSRGDTLSLSTLPNLVLKVEEILG